MTQRSRRAGVRSRRWLFASSNSPLAQSKDDKKNERRAEKGNRRPSSRSSTTWRPVSPAPNDLSLAWVREDLLKAQGNKQYVPFTVTLDPSKVAGGERRVLLARRREERRPRRPAADPDAKKDDKNDNDKGKKPEYAYEDISIVPVTRRAEPDAHQPVVHRAGRRLRRLSSSRRSRRPRRRRRMRRRRRSPRIKQTVDVPDFWNGELDTSSVIVAERIDPLPAPLTPQQQTERPYALGHDGNRPGLRARSSRRRPSSRPSC